MDIERALEAGVKLCGTQHLQLGRRELERERMPLEEVCDLLEGCGIEDCPLVQIEGLPSGIHEQGDRCGIVQFVDAQQRLQANADGLPGRHEYSELGHPLDQVSDGRSERQGGLLGVVEKEQAVLLGTQSSRNLGQRIGALELQPELPADLAVDGVLGGTAGEIGDPDTS